MTAETGIIVYRGHRRSRSTPSVAPCCDPYTDSRHEHVSNGIFDSSSGESVSHHHWNVGPRLDPSILVKDANVICPAKLTRNVDKRPRPDSLFVPKDTLDVDFNAIEAEELRRHLLAHLNPLETDDPCSTVECGILPSTPLEEHQMLLQEEEIRQYQRNCLNIIPEDATSSHNKVVRSSTGANDGGISVSVPHATDSGPAPTDSYYIPKLVDLYYVVEQFEDFASSMWRRFQSWKVMEFSSLPQWLQDNGYLHFGHRPPLNTWDSFTSIMRIHTETGNIWTHMLGVVAFIAVMIYFLTRPSQLIGLEEKLVFTCYFVGAILCLGMSFLFHVLCSHQNLRVIQFFNKMDYCGIVFLTVGSYISWIYYAFYCHFTYFYVYCSVSIVIGLIAAIVTTMDTFAGPRFRILRAVVFVAYGIFGVVPAIHYVNLFGWRTVLLNDSSFGFFVLAAVCYISGAAVYGLLIPERFFPGKVDIWFHSHQIFHCLVNCGAFVFYHSISSLATTRSSLGPCQWSQDDQLKCLEKEILLSHSP